MTVTLPLVMFHAGTVQFHALLVMAHIGGLAHPSVRNDGWWQYDSQTLATFTGLDIKKVSAAMAWLDRRGLVAIERTSKTDMQVQLTTLSEDWRAIWESRCADVRMRRELKNLNRSIKTKPMPLAAQAVLLRA